MNDSSVRVHLDLSFEEAQIVSEAMELIARIQMGQLDKIENEFTSSPRIEIGSARFDNVRAKLEELSNVSGLQNLGILHKDVPEHARIAWDMHQVVRRVLAYHRQPEGGLETHFDPPMLTSKRSSASAFIAGESKDEK